MAERYVHLLAAAVPKRYAFRLVFRDLKADAEFEGTARIELELTAATSVVELHAKDISVLSASVEPSGGGEASPMVRAEPRDATESVLLHLGSTLSGAVVLHCSYRGKVRGPLSGVYHCTFENDVAGISTHFEPVYARFAFPCIDEPKAKACFQLTIVAPEGLTAISNMPKTSSCPPAEGAGLVEHVFAETPRMSSYLVGFAVGDFGVIKMPDGEAPVPMSLYAQRGREESGRFLLEIAARSLAYFEKFFGEKFPLPKLDLVVAPDFPIGGMENWGIITFTNRTLITEAASFQKRRGVATLAAHEVSHMWFGDLVTPCWWDDLWLKEGFASWVNLLPLEEFFPSWRVWDHWAWTVVYGGSDSGHGGALEVDQYRATHPVEVAVNHPSDAQEIFDALSYEKGAAIVNMLYHALGRETFRKGLSQWLTRYKNSNSTTNDLWAELSQVSGQSIGEMIGTWTQQMGFPMVQVSRQAAGPGAACGEVWALRQKRFALPQAGGEPEDGSEEPQAKRMKAPLWKIPLRVVHDEGGAGGSIPETVILAEESMTLPVRGRWVFLNGGVCTPLRVCYPPELLKLLADDAATTGRLQAVDRAGLLSDTFAMLRAGFAAPADILGFVRTLLASEQDGFVWAAAVAMLRRLVDAFGKEAPSMSAFVSGLLSKQKARLGWAAASPDGAEESDDDKLLRPGVLGLLGACLDKDVGKEADEYCRAYLCSAHPAPPPPPLGGARLNLKQAFSSNCPACGAVDLPHAGVRGIALRIAASRDPVLWGSLLSRFAVVSDSEERDQLLVALAGHADRAALEAWLEKAFGGDLPSQEWGTLFAGLALNRHHERIAWETLVRHWGPVFKAWGESQMKMKSIVKSSITSAVSVAEVEAFFKAHPCDTVRLVVRQRLEGLVADKELRARAPQAEAALRELTDTAAA